MGKHKIPLKDRFWKKVAIEGLDQCWNWLGAKCSKGYGSVGVEHDQIRGTHRVVYELIFGTIPNGLKVLHRCDNPPCCNPFHLFLGTDKDNRADCISKHRENSTKGSQHPKHKLTEADIPIIKGLREDGVLTHEIARRYRVHKATIKRILNGSGWSHV